MRSTAALSTASTRSTACGLPIDTTENQIAFARQYYNDLVMRFNTRQEVFPSNLVAGFFNFKPAEFFAVPEAEKAAPRVDLSLPA